MESSPERLDLLIRVLSRGLVHVGTAHSSRMTARLEEKVEEEEIK